MLSWACGAGGRSLVAALVDSRHDGLTAAADVFAHHALRAVAVLGEDEAEYAVVFVADSLRRPGWDRDARTRRAWASWFIGVR